MTSVVVDLGCAIWAPWLPGYEVSSDGRIRNIKTGTIRKTQHSGRPRDYRTVAVMRGGKRYRYPVHRAVLEAFIGPRPPGGEARHLNDNKNDNRLENLVWGTRKENVSDAIRNGRFKTGERASWSLLTESQVREIRVSDEKEVVLAKRYGVARTTIAGIRHRRTWKWVMP